MNEVALKVAVLCRAVRGLIVTRGLIVALVLAAGLLAPEAYPNRDDAYAGRDPAFAQPAFLYNGYASAPE